MPYSELLHRTLNQFVRDYKKMPMKVVISREGWVSLREAGLSFVIDVSKDEDVILFQVNNRWTEVVLSEENQDPIWIG